MEELIEIDAFLKRLRHKERQIVYTFHAINEAKRRKLISENEKEIKIFEADIKEGTIYLGVEQSSELPGEKKFKLYYHYREGGFIVYVISLDGEIRLITVYRTSKSLQKKVYKYIKSKGYYEKH